MEKELFALVEELFKTNETHEVLNVNGKSLVLDTKKDGNKMVITITLNEDKKTKDKKEFERWLDQLDDDIFQEAWDTLSENYGLKELNDEYESGDYAAVIRLFKNKTSEIAKQKVSKLQKLFNL